MRLFSGVLIPASFFAWVGCSPAMSAGQSAHPGSATPVGTRSDAQIEELEQSIEDLEDLVRRMNADLGVQLDAIAAQLSVLSTKVEAQDRWLNRLATGALGRRTAGNAADEFGLPSPGESVAYLDQTATHFPDLSAPEPFRPAEPGTAFDSSAAGSMIDLDAVISAPRMDSTIIVAVIDSAAREPESGEMNAGHLDPTGESPGEVGTLIPEPPEEGRRLYEIAYSDLMQENYQLALINFRAFLKRHPGTRLSDNAQYWIGEVYYAQGQYGLAIEEFRRVIEEYPGQDKVPAACYKAALSFEHEEDQATARRYLEYLIEQFPDSREAGLAHERLERY